MCVWVLFLGRSETVSYAALSAGFGPGLAKANGVQATVTATTTTEVEKKQHEMMAASL